MPRQIIFTRFMQTRIYSIAPIAKGYTDINAKTKKITLTSFRISRSALISGLSIFLITFHILFFIMSSYSFAVMRSTVKLQEQLHSLDILKFSPAYLLELTATGESKISIDNYRIRCTVPIEPINPRFIDDPSEMDSIITKTVAHQSVTAMVSESASWSTPFAMWPKKFQNRFTFKPSNYCAKGVC